MILKESEKINKSLCSPLFHLYFFCIHYAFVISLIQPRIYVTLVKIEAKAGHSYRFPKVSRPTTSLIHFAGHPPPPHPHPHPHPHPIAETDLTLLAINQLETYHIFLCTDGTKPLPEPMWAPPAGSWVLGAPHKSPKIVTLKLPPTTSSGYVTLIYPWTSAVRKYVLFIVDNTSYIKDKYQVEWLLLFHLSDHHAWLWCTCMLVL